MFGSLPAMAALYAILSADATIQAAVADRLFGMTVVPQDVPLPALLFYPVTAEYSGPLNGVVDAEVLEFDVKLICAGASATPLADAAGAIMTALNGTSFTQDGVTGSFWAEREIPFLTLVEEGNVYTQLGVTFQAQLSAGG